MVLAMVLAMVSMVLWLLNYAVRWLVVLALLVLTLSACGPMPTRDHTLELRPSDGPVLRVWGGAM